MVIAICDDEKIFHTQIGEFLTSFFEKENTPEIKNYYSGAELLNDIESNNSIDILFLDIELGDQSGIEIAHKIKESSQNTIIIFISSHPQYVFEAFKCEAFHFLVKPISLIDFEDVFNRALHKYKIENNNVAFAWNHTKSNIRISDILFIEGYRRRLDIHTPHGVFFVTGKVSDAYSYLKNLGFVQVHQGFIVNMNYIESFRQNEVILYNGEKVAVSQRKRAEAIMVYDKYIQKWKW